MWISGDKFWWHRWKNLRQEAGSDVTPKKLQPNQDFWIKHLFFFKSPDIMGQLFLFFITNSSRDPLTRHCSGNNIYRPPSAIAWVVHTLLSRVSEDDCYINSLWDHTPAWGCPACPGETTGGWCWSTTDNIYQNTVTNWSSFSKINSISNLWKTWLFLTNFDRFVCFCLLFSSWE